MMSYLCLIIILLAFAIELFQAHKNSPIILCGTAIDINPLYNPYIVNNTVIPVSATAFVDRSQNQKYYISKI